MKTFLERQGRAELVGSRLIKSTIQRSGTLTPIPRTPPRDPLRQHGETLHNRLKDFRRIATRYDKLARNYLASICLVAALAYWPILFSNSGFQCQALRDRLRQAHCSLRGRDAPSA